MRLGLDESLEAYTKRHAFRSVDEARPAWRQDAIFILNGVHVSCAHVSMCLARIAPGVTVPTKQVTWSEGEP